MRRVCTFEAGGLGLDGLMPTAPQARHRRTFRSFGKTRFRREKVVFIDDGLGATSRCWDCLVRVVEESACGESCDKNLPQRRLSCSSTLHPSLAKQRVRLSGRACGAKVLYREAISSVKHVSEDSDLRRARLHKPFETRAIRTIGGSRNEHNWFCNEGEPGKSIGNKPQPKDGNHSPPKRSHYPNDRSVPFVTWFHGSYNGFTIPLL